MKQRNEQSFVNRSQIYNQLSLIWLDVKVRSVNDDFEWQNKKKQKEKHYLLDSTFMCSNHGNQL